MLPAAGMLTLAESLATATPLPSTRLVMAPRLTKAVMTSGPAASSVPSRRTRP